jgi:hypothetical protein
LGGLPQRGQLIHPSEQCLEGKVLTASMPETMSRPAATVSALLYPMTNRGTFGKAVLLGTAGDGRSDSGQKANPRATPICRAEFNRQTRSQLHAIACGGPFSSSFIDLNAWRLCPRFARAESPYRRGLRLDVCSALWLRAEDCDPYLLVRGHDSHVYFSSPGSAPQ